MFFPANKSVFYLIFSFCFLLHSNVVGKRVTDIEFDTRIVLRFSSEIEIGLVPRGGTLRIDETDENYPLKTKKNI